MEYCAYFPTQAEAQAAARALRLDAWGNERFLAMVTKMAAGNWRVEW